MHSTDDVSYKAQFNLSGKTVIVTGGTGILGRCFCEGLAEFGADLIIVDLHEDDAVSFASKLSKKHQVRCSGFACDISSPSSVAEMVDRVDVKYGKIDVLVNNAAWKSDSLDEYFASYEEYNLDQWRKIMSVNVEGMFLLSQKIGNLMVERGAGGSMIQMASIYGPMAPDHRIYEGSYYLGRQINTPAVYSTSKAAVVGLTKHLATYWGEHNIRVNAIAPGGVESGQNEIFKRKYSSRIPLGRMAKREEIVGAMLYLASDASSYVTGQTLFVDGGLSAW